MHRIRLPLAALALLLLAACQSAAPTAPRSPRQPSSATAVSGDSLFGVVARDGTLMGSGN